MNDDTHISIPTNIKCIDGCYTHSPMDTIHANLLLNYTILLIDDDHTDVFNDTATHNAMTEHIVYTPTSCTFNYL